MTHTQNHSNPWKTAAIAGGIVAVTIIALLVFLLMRKEETPMQAYPETNTPSMNSNVGETADENYEEGTWNTYQDDENRFSFQYPKDWAIEKQNPYPNSAMVFNPESLEDVPTNGGGSVQKAMESVSFTISENESGTPKQVEDLYPQGDLTFYDLSEPSERDTIQAQGTTGDAFYMRAGRESVGWHVIYSNENITVDAHVQCENTEPENKCNISAGTFADILESFQFAQAESGSDINTTTSNNWTTQKQRQVVDYFQGYTVAFPDGWYVETQSFEEPPSVISTIQNDTTTIEINQGPSSAGRCLFPEDPDSLEQMMGSEYGPYEVIQKGSTVWRYASTIGSDGSEKIICEKQDDGSFLAVTNIGYITVQNPEPSTEGQVVEILERLQIE